MNAAPSTYSVDYICVLDFEATCNEEKPTPKPQEIIEFPTVLLNAHTGEIEDEFHNYIKPDVHPTLSAFCTDLTGITQDVVDAGIPLHQAILLHQQWINERGLVPVHATTSNNCSPTSPKFIYLTVGDWDLKTCLPSQLHYHNEKVPSIFKSWINIKYEFENFYGKKARGMTGMLRALDIELQGRHHSGIDDCRNTVSIVQQMMKDGWLPGNPSSNQQCSMIIPTAQTLAEEVEKMLVIKAEKEKARAEKEIAKRNKEETKRLKKERRAAKLAQRTGEEITVNSLGAGNQGVILDGSIDNDLQPDNNNARKGILIVGVVGTSSYHLVDKTTAAKAVDSALEEVEAKAATLGKEVVIISGAGMVPKFAFQWATKKGMLTKQIVSSAVRSKPPVETERICIGKSRGDESEEFIKLIDVLVRVGGGPRSHRELERFKDAHPDSAVVERELPLLSRND